MRWKLDLNQKYKSTFITIQAAEMTEQLSALTTFIDQLSHTLSVQKKNEQTEIHIRDIVYIENVERITFIYTPSDIYEVILPLYELETMLKKFGFIRINKQTIINSRCIKSVKALLNSRFELLMITDEKLIVTRHYRKEFKKLFAKGGIYDA